jgi:hypothetical protein
MATEAKREAIEKYFKPFPKWAIFFIVIGIVILYLFGSQQSVGGIVTGVVILAIGAFAVFSASGKPSDEKMDEYIVEDLSLAKSKSLHKASIDESELVGDSVVVTGPRLWNTAGAGIRFKKGDDGKLRFTPINVSVLHMTEHQIVSYQACLDILTGNFLNESTDEYFYKDIVSVSTRTESRTLECDNAKLGKTIHLNAAEIFVLTTSGGTSVETILKDPKLIELMGGGNIPTTEAERAIQVIRKMLREKKQN